MVYELLTSIGNPSAGFIKIEEDSPAADTYKYYFDMEKWKAHNFRFDLDGGTSGNTMIIKLYGTMQKDGTDPEDCEYDDITNDTFGVASISCPGGVTKQVRWIDNGNELGANKYIMLEIVHTTGGGQDASWLIHGSKK